MAAGRTKEEPKEICPRRREVSSPQTSHISQQTEVCLEYGHITFVYHLSRRRCQQVTATLRVNSQTLARAANSRPHHRCTGQTKLIPPTGVLAQSTSINPSCLANRLTGYWGCSTIPKLLPVWQPWALSTHRRELACGCDGFCRTRNQFSDRGEKRHHGRERNLRTHPVDHHRTVGR